MPPKSDKEIEVTDVAEEENYTATRKSADKEQQPETVAQGAKVIDKKTEPPQPENHIEPPVVAQPQKVRKVEDGKLLCPDCGRLLSKKTLNYSHKYQCKGQKSIIEIEDVKDDKRGVANQEEEGSPKLTVRNHKPSQPKAPVTNTRRPPVRRYDHINIF